MCTCFDVSTAIRFQAAVNLIFQGEELSVPSHMPQLDESGLSVEEHRNLALAVSDLADPQVTFNKRQKRGKYFDEDRAKIAKYAVENGNESAHKRLREQFPNLNEGIFKKLAAAAQSRVQSRNMTNE